MKKFAVFCGMLLLLVVGVSAQEKDRGSSQEFQREEEMLKNLMESGKFEFLAETVFPMGQPPKNIVGEDYSISFSSEKITSVLPFYGSAHRGMILGKDKGMRFHGQPENFHIERRNEGYEISATVKTRDDVFRISLTAKSLGNASLSISSNNRSTISYQGEIVAPSE